MATSCEVDIERTVCHAVGMTSNRVFRRQYGKVGRRVTGVLTLAFAIWALFIAPEAAAQPATTTCPDDMSAVWDECQYDTTTERITEDDPRWDCVSMGDRVCGPTNAQGVPAACYDDGGVIVAPWPCYVVTNVDGSSDVYTTAGDAPGTGPAADYWDATEYVT